jgi:hypothetical protein
MRENWIWLGHKQHLIVARNCWFSLSTLLPNGYLVSTIGEYYRENETEMTEIGLDRFYETMVFKTNGILEKCGCPVISDFSEIKMRGYISAKEAQIGHIKICEEFDSKID